MLCEHKPQTIYPSQFLQTKTAKSHLDISQNLWWKLQLEGKDVLKRGRYKLKDENSKDEEWHQEREIQEVKDELRFKDYLGGYKIA